MIAPLLVCLALAVQQDDMVPSAMPDAKVSGVAYRPGFSAIVEWKPGHAIEPMESSLQIVLHGPNNLRKVIHSLNDFRGSVDISTPDEALRFCRIWTSKRYMWYFDQIAREVHWAPPIDLSRTLKKSGVRLNGPVILPNGFEGAIHEPAWKNLVTRYPKVFTYGSGFVIERLIIKPVDYRRCKLYVSREEVGFDGSFRAILSTFRTGTSFDRITWFIPFLL
ncbi:MAG: hypothetical protein JSS72_00865 [Armatimonadetes bacterium]|nr:hypothetical protein [Armatimonadota bacterium]